MASKSKGIDWLSNMKIDWDQFQEVRKEVLTQWPTGQQVELDEAFAYHKSLPDTKNTIKMMQHIGTMVIVGRGAHTDFGNQRSFLSGASGR